ncbi:MAG: glycosidase, partial [Ruminococcus sp.]
MNLLFTFRGVPCIYYGTEVEFAKGMVIDVGPNAPLSQTGRAYFGDYMEGSVNATDFGVYTASGKVAETLNAPLSVHLRQLNLIRQAVPALQKGQYTCDSNYVSGNMAYVRRYTNAEEGIDSLACVTLSGGATFKNIPNGKYIDAVTGDVQNVTNGTLTVGSLAQGNMRCYVACGSGFTGIDGKIGQTGTYLK